MLLQIKVYLFTIVYLTGALFMLYFPPRNYKQTAAKIRTPRSANTPPKFNHYVNYNEVEYVAERLAKNDPEVVKLVRLTPKTYENRSLIALELRSDRGSDKPGILVIGALDGMAWGAPSAILDLTEKLLYDSNYQAPFINDYDWFIIPLANPDGLTFTQKLRKFPSFDVNNWCLNKTASKTHRPNEWHKNVDRDNQTKGECFGTHINRNFPYHWQDGVVKTPNRCSQLYPGIKPFSTAEADAVRQYVQKIGDSISLAIHVHASFLPRKDRLMYPWRFARKAPSNLGTLQAIGEYAARYARMPDGRIYEVHQSSSDLDGRVAGSLEDYLMGVVGIDHVFVVKPYHQMYPNFTDISGLDLYINKCLKTILGLVRGWRLGDECNTLSFFGKIVEF